MYHESYYLGDYHLQGTLRNLERAGYLTEGYMVYEQEEGISRIALGEYAKLIVTNNKIFLEEQGVKYSFPLTDPFKQMGQILKGVSINDWKAYGYLSFDLVRHYYSYHKSSIQPDMHFFIPRTEIVFMSNNVSVYSLDEIDPISSCLVEMDETNFDFNLLKSNFEVKVNDHEDYMSNVSALVDSIRNQNLAKAILSRAVEISGNLDVLSTYQLATNLNNSARSYIVELDQIKAIGCSPEILLQTKDGRTVTTNPLAGTRPRGKSEEEDKALQRELIHNPKEVKEHSLSVLLAQEELASVCVKDHVHVYNFLEIKPYRCVQHLSSRVSGVLKDDKTVYDALKALFPGVTVSGISKEKSIEWINKLEQQPRGIYAGAIGWIDSNGDSDLAIAIRSIYQYGDRVFLNAGAGIVEESIPEFEYMETYNKMNTMKKTIILK